MKEIVKNNFIGEFQIEDEICDALIEFHKSIDPALPGDTTDFIIQKTVGVSGALYDPTLKDSTDVVIKPVVFQNLKMVPVDLKAHLKILMSYWFELNVCVRKYRDMLCFEETREAISNWETHINIHDAMVIQHYKPGQGFKAWHTERANVTMNRSLVYMTYLNDVPDGGTHFYYQDMTVEAKKGKTLIWPADFTHIHKGQISHEHEKYIVTGWFSYDKNTRIF